LEKAKIQYKDTTQKEKKGASLTMQKEKGGLSHHMEERASHNLVSAEKKVNVVGVGLGVTKIERKKRGERLSIMC
jgi:hypothetical protein